MRTVNDLPEDAKRALAMVLVTARTSFPNTPEEMLTKAFLDGYFKD
jgi:hypothetical protein